MTTKVIYIAARERGPGPGRYGLPPTCGFNSHDYTKVRFPAYSIGGRLEDPTATFRTPSPGRYRPENVHPQGEPHAPNYSMSTRIKSRRKDNNPSPNTYCLPTLLGSGLPNKCSSPSYSMKKYTVIGSYAEDLSKAPGPGQYHATQPDLIRERKPQYSLQGRSTIPTDGLKKPGPGAHRPEAVYINKPQAPRPSLGIRHSEFIMPFIPY